MNKLKEFLPEIIAIIAVALLVGIFIFVSYVLSIDHDSKLWNDGCCNICGSTWEYEQAVGHTNYTSYIYVCRKCGKRIELNEMR